MIFCGCRKSLLLSEIDYECCGNCEWLYGDFGEEGSWDVCSYVVKIFDEEGNKLSYSEIDHQQSFPEFCPQCEREGRGCDECYPEFFV